MCELISSPKISQNSRVHRILCQRSCDNVPESVFTSERSEKQHIKSRVDIKEVARDFNARCNERKITKNSSLRSRRRCADALAKLNTRESSTEEFFIHRYTFSHSRVSLKRAVVGLKAIRKHLCELKTAKHDLLTVRALDINGQSVEYRQSS